MINNKTASEYLLSNFIAKGQENSLTLDNTNLKAEVRGLIIPVRNILRQKYRSLILLNSFELTLDTEQMYNAYKWKPKLLSYRLYNTTDLWHLLLWLNDMTSVTQFNKRSFIVFDPDAMPIMNQIIELESNAMLANRNNPEQVINEEKISRR